MKSVPSSHWILPRDHRETHVTNAFNQCITKAKLLELTTQQPNKLRDYLLGKNSDLFRKPGDQKDGRLLSQRIIFAEVEFGFLLHEKISIASLQIWTYCSKGTHSSTLAWKIPWMPEPGRLQSIGLLRGWTRLGDFTFTFHFHALEKEMATHSSVLAWRIPGMREPGGLPSMGSHRVRYDWSDVAAAAAAAAAAAVAENLN